MHSPPETTPELDLDALSSVAELAREGWRRALSSAGTLDMTRGKPCAEQLDLSAGLLTVLAADDYRSEDGIDCRNYGGVEGLPEARRLFGDYLGVASNRILVQDNSSLRLMHDLVLQALIRGVPGGHGPWLEQRPIRFLCPVPGYDRHFALLEHFGIEMIPIPLDEEGPDLGLVADHLANDGSIRGMFCVPKYSNPTGIVYSDRVVEALAEMPSAAADFRVFWDNAYARHDLMATDAPGDHTESPALADFLVACERAGRPERPLVFGSTSKISFGGAGVSMVAASERNLAAIVQSLSKQTIGPDKINQLRHVRFFVDLQGICEHMARHAAILRPKFDRVEEVLSRRLEALGVATWTRPLGGYFISLDLLPGCARRVVELAAEAGLRLTAAGATFPHGKDPLDRNLRLAPSFPSVEEVGRAAELIADCVVLASLEKSQSRPA